MSASARFLGLSLLGSLMLTACPRQGGNPDTVRKSGGAGLEEVAHELFEFECSCIAMVSDIEGEECLELTEELLETDEIVECVDQALARHPEARSPFACLLDQQYDYLECQTAQGCPGAYTCADDSVIPEAWMCDGEPDCADGGDEIGCTAPHTCDDGQTVPRSWVCDGWTDCEDGSDEPAHCPETCEAALDIEQCPELPEAFTDTIDELCSDESSSEPSCSDETCADVPVGPPSPLATIPGASRRSSESAGMRAARLLARRR